MSTNNTEKVRVFCLTPIYSGTDGMVNGALIHSTFSSYEKALEAARDEVVANATERDEEIVIIDDVLDVFTVVHSYDTMSEEWSAVNVPSINDDELLEFADTPSIYLYKSELD